MTGKSSLYGGLFFCLIFSEKACELSVSMSDIFEKYKLLYGSESADSDVTIIIHKEEPRELYFNPVYDNPPPSNPRTTVNDRVPDVRNMIRQLLEQEAHIRNQREKYRMNYYKLEAANAPKEEFAKNFAIIRSLTDQLATPYIQRKKIEQSGRIETTKEVTQDEENEIRRLKYDKKRMIDKKHKLQKKIDTYMSFARGPQNLSMWESEIEGVRLEIFDLEERIKRLQGE
jgi:hypothetical protein